MKVGLQLLDSMTGEGLTGFLRDAIFKIRAAIDSAHLGFGDGTNNDNMFGAWINYTTNAIANTEDGVAHNLGFIPIGYLVVMQDKAASIYKGSTAWTTSTIYLKSSVASVVVRIFVLGPSNQQY